MLRIKPEICHGYRRKLAFTTPDDLMKSWPSYTRVYHVLAVPCTKNCGNTVAVTSPYRSLGFRKISPQKKPKVTRRGSLAKRPHVTLEMDRRSVLADMVITYTDIRDFTKSSSRRANLLSREEREAARQDDEPEVLAHHGPLTASIGTVSDSPDVLDCPIGAAGLN